MYPGRVLTPWKWARLKILERRVFRENQLFNVEYLPYLQTPQWKAKARIKKQVQPWCFVCIYDFVKKGRILNTNHDNYRNLGHEKPSELFNVCEDHHPKGAYTWGMARHDRFVYQGKKLLLKTLNPIYWCWLLLKGLYFAGLALLGKFP